MYLSTRALILFWLEIITCTWKYPSLFWYHINIFPFSNLLKNSTTPYILYFLLMYMFCFRTFVFFLYTNLLVGYSLGIYVTLNCFSCTYFVYSLLLIYPLCFRFCSFRYSIYQSPLSIYLSLSLLSSFYAFNIPFTEKTMLHNVNYKPRKMQLLSSNITMSLPIFLYQCTNV